MPAIVVAIAAAVAGAAATSVAAGLIGSTLLGYAFLATAAASLVGGIVATAAAYGLSAIFGLNNAPKQRGGLSQQANDRKQLVRSSIEPRQVIYGTARVSGPMIYASSSGEDRRYLHLVIPLANHAIDGIDAVWINDQRIGAVSIDGNGDVTEGPFGPVTSGRPALVKVQIANGTQTTANATLVAQSTDGWGSDHVLQGVAYAYIRMEYNQEAFPNGLQNVSFQVRGKRDIYDPRTRQFGFTHNAALIILDYLRSQDGLACADDEIDFDAFIAAANVCDENVVIDAVPTGQRRYDCDGAFGLDRAPLDIMEDMLTSCAGTLVYVQGKYRIHVGAYEAPTDTLTVSDLAGDIELVTKPPRRDLFNGVRGTFIDPDRSWQASEFTPYYDSTFVTEDGEAIWRDAELPFTIDNKRAQRLAKLMLRRARESLTIRVPVQYKGIRYSVWQTLAVTIDDFGWTAKPFRIQSWAFAPDTGIITLTLREESAGSYAWSYADLGIGSTSPDTNLIDAFSIPAPAGLTISEELYATRDGAGVRTRATLAWAPPGYPFIRSYDVQYRAVGDAVWRVVAPTLGETRAVIDDLADGSYEWRVRAVGSVASGEWAVTTAPIGGLASQPPAGVTGLAVQSIGGFAFLRWNLHPDLDVRVGGRIEFRHSSNNAATDWVSSTSIGNAVSGAHTTVVMPLKPGVYFAKAVDAGGRYSSAVAMIGASQATALAFANVDSLTEHTAFSGAKTGVVVTDNTIRLDSSGNIDAEASFDAISNIDNLGGVLSSGTYDFSAGIDVLSVQPVRLTSNIKAVVINTFDAVDARPAMVDDWLDWDGAIGGEADAWVEVRTTQNNPSSSPVWDSWRRLDASEFVARGFEFRAQLRSYDPAFNIHISELTAVADEVA